MMPVAIIPLVCETEYDDRCTYYSIFDNEFYDPTFDYWHDCVYSNISIQKKAIILNDGFF